MRDFISLALLQVRSVLRMSNSQNKANGVKVYISTTIFNLNSYIDKLEELKVNILVPSENEEVNNKYKNEYEELLIKSKDALLDLYYINYKYFFGKIGEYVLERTKKLLRIIDMAE